MRPLISKFPQVTMTHVCYAAGVKVPDAGTAQGFRGSGHGEDYMCLNFLVGYCSNGVCQHAHLLARELPKGYEEDLCTAVRPGVTKLLAMQSLPRSQRKNRNNRSNGGFGRY